MELPENVREMLAIRKIQRIFYLRIHADPTLCKLAMVMAAILAFFVLIVIQVEAIFTGPYFIAGFSHDYPELFEFFRLFTLLV
ncbi:MAG: hypothetical protein AAF797_10240 [Planctomycetota bacterium]